jgi:hypothetical protein
MLLLQKLLTPKIIRMSPRKTFHPSLAEVINTKGINKWGKEILS